MILRYIRGEPKPSFVYTEHTVISAARRDPRGVLRDEMGLWDGFNNKVPHLPVAVEISETNDPPHRVGPLHFTL